ncbi:MAG: hypothetical protein NXH85_11785, partial [Pseudomonadaceae bacterium]|nr:hypothetical protein [Pseudomonadaceae bacterium]
RRCCAAAQPNASRRRLKPTSGAAQPLALTRALPVTASERTATQSALRGSLLTIGRHLRALGDRVVVALLRSATPRDDASQWRSATPRDDG